MASLDLGDHRPRGGPGIMGCGSTPGWTALRGHAKEKAMTNFLKRFAQDESGAVTVDWVVLCAAVVGIGIAVAGTMKTSIDGVADRIGDDINAALDE
jgi:Flp pilus assembly pilin Flp